MRQMLRKGKDRSDELEPWQEKEKENKTEELDRGHQGRLDVLGYVVDRGRMNGDGQRRMEIRYPKWRSA